MSKILGDLHITTSNSATLTDGLRIDNSNGNRLFDITNTGIATFNDGNLGSADFRIKGVTNDNLFFVDSSTNRIGIGGATSAYTLKVSPTTTGMAIEAADTSNSNTTLALLASGGTLAQAFRNGGDVDLNIAGGVTTIGTVTSGAFKLNVENNLYVKSTSGNAEIEISADAVGQAFLQINNQNTNLDSYIHFANAGTNEISMGWDDSVGRFRMGTSSISTGIFFDHDTGLGTRTLTNFGVGTSYPASTTRFLVRGANSTNATNTMTVQNSSGNASFNISDDNSVVFNGNAISTANFSIYGDTDTNLFRTNASTDSIGIGIGGQSTSKLYVDATNETRTWIGVFGSNTATNGVYIVPGTPAADSFGIQAQAKTNGNFTARGVWGDATAATSRTNYGVYGRSGNGKQSSVGVLGQQVFASTGSTNVLISAGVWGTDDSPNTPVKHGVYGSLSSGTGGVTTTGYAVRGLSQLDANDATSYALHGRISLSASVTGATGYGLFIEDGSAVGAGTTVYGLVVEDVNENSGFGTATPSATVDIVGDLSYRWSSTASMATTENDYSTTNTSALRLTANAAGTNITGFANGVDGKELSIVNIHASQQIAITHQDTGSIAANRVINGSTAGTVVLSPNDTAIYKYDGTTQRWRFMSKGDGQ